MMAYVAKQVVDIANMPRGGPDPSCLDRLLQTGSSEYLDRYDVQISTSPFGPQVVMARRWR
jgi:hypothetical protein